MNQTPVEEHKNSNNSPYKFNGKELDDETGNYYYGARYYDPKTSIWLSVDPLAEKYPGWSPYNYTMNNPINLTDPTGKVVESPVYDKKGNLLGTDDQGLQGKAIVMNKSDFTQGMKHSEAMKKDQGVKGLNSFTSIMKYQSSYEHLPERPDYDGVVTISEGIKWAKEHPNTLPSHITPENSLYLDASKLNFGNLSVSNFPLPEGKQGNVDLIDYVNLLSASSRSTTYALGNTQMKLLDAKTGSVKLFSDNYDWDYHNTAGSTKRDNLLFLERTRTHLDDSHGFRINIYGTGKVKTK